MYIQSMVLICRDRGEVITSHEGYFSFADFYDADILNLELLGEHARSGEAIVGRSFTNRSGENLNVITYASRLFTMDAEDGNFLITNIRVEKLLQGMGTNKWEHGSDLMIDDASGAMILDNSGGRIARARAEISEVELAPGDHQDEIIAYEGRPSILLRWKNGYNGWVYTSICPIEDGFMPLLYLRNISLSLLGVAIVCILALFYVLQAKIYRPFRVIINKIQRTQSLVRDENAAGFQLLEQTLDKVLDANTAMQGTYLESVLVGGRTHSETPMFGQWDARDYRTLLFSLMREAEMDNSTVLMEHRRIQSALLAQVEGEIDLSEDSYRFVPLMGHDLVMILRCNGGTEDEALRALLPMVVAQINALENFITMEVDAIIVSALDTAAAEDVLQRAKDAGIKIVSQSSRNETRDVWVSAEEFNMGWTNGRGLGEWLLEKYGAEGTPTVAVFGWDVIPTQVLRGDGMVAGILECVPGANVIRQNANTPAQGQEVADSLLQANPDLCGIVTINDAAAIGAYSAVQAANKDNEDFYIGGIDATAEALDIIKGDCSFRATVDLIPYENGAIDVDLCVQLVAGEAVEDPYVIPAKLVNITNIGEYFN